MLEECCSEIKYIKEPGNGAADALSRLMLINSCIKEKDTTTGHLSESYSVEKLDSNTLPLTYQTIDKYKRKDKNIVEKLKRANYHNKYFRGGVNTFMIICKNDKIVVPTILRKYLVNWYHTYLLYPGTERREENISQHYYWPNLRDNIRTNIKVCNTCQKNKKKNFN